MASIWQRFPNLSPPELRSLVAATAQTLYEVSDARGSLPADLLQISTSGAAREVQSALPEVKADQVAAVQQLLEDDDSSAELSIAILSEVSKHPELASRIAAAYEQRSRKMTGLEPLLMVGALVVLAIKIKKIEWGKDGGSITFSESADVVKSFLLGLLK